MSAPYKRFDFTARSGNVCRLRLFPPVEDRLVVDCAWEHISSGDDVRECNEWAIPKLQQYCESIGRHVVGAMSTKIEDADDREAVIASMLQKRRQG